jgi:nucleoside-diphosphate-sugar epimerase
LRAFITGATGLVGFNIVRRLLTSGHDILACVRAKSPTEALRALSGHPAIVIAELDDPIGLAREMQGCAVVVHCAGSVDPHARREDIYKVNVEGTRSVLGAAVAAGVKQFIHISSLSVITANTDQYNVNESVPIRYCGEAYADSKVDAEKIVQLETTGRIATTILRPGFIYGPYEKAWLPSLIKSLRDGKVVLIDGGTKQTNVIFVENLSRAIELSLLNRAAFQQVYNLTDGLTPSKKELFDTVCRELMLPPVTKRVPGFLARSICNATSAVAPLLPPGKRQQLSRFSKAAYRLAGLNQGFDISKAERELKYVERIPFTEAMASTLRHFKDYPGDSTASAASKHERLSKN